MKVKEKKILPLWRKLLNVIIILVASVASSQVATTSPILDSAVKTAIVTTSNVLIDALSSNSADTAIIITEKPAADSVRVQIN